ncbi:MAG TPA: mechanosensitive ion channel, partial [Turneriella sp.]|nr:mechanosensitive ion channel [Turneriella sp.]
MAWINDNILFQTAIVTLIALVIHFAIFAILKFIAGRTRSHIDDVFVDELRNPTRFLLPVILCQALLPTIQQKLSQAHHQLAVESLRALTIALIAWSIARSGRILEKIVLQKQKAQEGGDIRSVLTQIRMLRRVFSVIIFIAAAGLVLMSFTSFRQIGTGLLASAGVVGLLLGVTAQRGLGNLLAGIQIALAQPIRHDDVVSVENEWGVVEEITLTYVTIRLWDKRRLIVPVGFFLEKPFQNWTRATSNIAAYITLWVDYSVRLDTIRTEFKKLCATSSLWDKELCQIVVVNSDNIAVELRLLMSAKTPQQCLELKYFV